MTLSKLDRQGGGVGAFAVPGRLNRVPAKNTRPSVPADVPEGRRRLRVAPVAVGKVELKSSARAR